MADARYFELNDDVGLDHEGNPQPLVETGLTIARPTMVGGEVVDAVESVPLTPIPGTRILKIEDPVVANAMSTHPLYHETEAPSKKDLDAARKTTEAARATDPPADENEEA